MRRRAFIAFLGGAAAAWPLAARAQQPKRIPRIGFLSSYSSERDTTYLAAFQHGLRELGYLPGNDLVVERRHAGGQFEKLAELAAELVGLKVDVLVAAGTPAALAAKNTTPVVPIVVTNVADPVGMGLVTSLARPGGNITGLSDLDTDVVAKRLELLKELVPSASRVGALVNPANPTNPPQLELTRAAAQVLGVTLLVFEVRQADEIDRAFTAIGTGRPGALIVIGDPLFSSYRRKIVELSAEGQLPAIYSHRDFPEVGGLMSYGTNFHELYRRAAGYVDKLLRGAKPGDLPVEQPTKFELVINRKSAKALGLTVSPSLLAIADEVIE